MTKEQCIKQAEELGEINISHLIYLTHGSEGFSKWNEARHTLYMMMDRVRDLQCHNRLQEIGSQKCIQMNMDIICKIPSIGE